MNSKLENAWSRRAVVHRSTSAGVIGRSFEEDSPRGVDTEVGIVSLTAGYFLCQAEKKSGWL